MTNPSDCRHPNNAGIYAPPRNWEIACAVTQAKHKVPLTEAQKAALSKLPKWKHHWPANTMAEMHRMEKK